MRPVEVYRGGLLYAVESSDDYADSYFYHCCYYYNEDFLYRAGDYLPQYMAAMVKLKNAIDYFTEHHPGSPEYSAVVGNRKLRHDLYTLTLGSLEREIYLILLQYSLD